MKVLAAMSGGVDSAVAAARAVEAGHEVVGVHLALSRQPGTLRTGARGCCTIEDAMDARRVADKLGIDFYVWDFSEQFADRVVDDFVAEYAAGRTPNPCMRCNERIKFAALLERARALGFDALVTGHYAEVREGWAGKELHRAASWAKDQSYVLGVLTTEQLEHSMFPLGVTPTKDQVRAEAAERGFSVSAKPDSHDICFIPDGDTRAWLTNRLGAAPGEVVDRDGEIVGSHEGTHGYTIGQRRGLALGRPAADGQPRYVLAIRPKERQVVVGPREALDVRELAGVSASWAGADPVASGIAEWGESFSCQVQVRAHADPVDADAVITADGVTVRPHTSIQGVAPGQTAVLYAGTRVLGQFTIDRTVSVDDAALVATAG